MSGNDDFDGNTLSKSLADARQMNDVFLLAFSQDRREHYLSENGRELIRHLFNKNWSEEKVEKTLCRNVWKEKLILKYINRCPEFDPDRVTKTKRGLLVSKRRYSKAKRKTMYEIQGRNLTYENAKGKRKSILLTNSEIIDRGDKGFQIKLEKGRIYKIKTKTEQEKNDWIKALEYAKEG